MTGALVTGISGRDGSYLAERLLAEGVEVHALVLRDDASPYTPTGVTLHHGDLTDVEAIRRLVLDLAPDEVYNLAAISSVAQSWDEPDTVARVNGPAAVALMESARQVGDHVRFIRASSAEIFGQPDSSPQSETTPVRPLNPYGAAKAYAHLAIGVQRQRGAHASSLVLYNHESPRRPERFVTRKITAGVAAIAHGRAGTLTLGNLEARRDWGWAPDYVDAMLRAARADEPDDYVVATGVGHTVCDFVATAFGHAGITDWEPLVSSDPALTRPADATDLTGDATHARDQLGWEPTVDFDGLVAAMVAADMRENS
ncbi:GDP-mannose 4,6-dehydratase [Nocardioides sp. B-3]|uniref:GDP-mannose 4,6-dehydratase n=1 Tax=Nocardioides sp. B-3 TaxID=2895565 RepID=UPI002152A1D4|nr:GDP-mannose 4,6-dehydratase [Nocardioides sp. B-3]UUZ57671.1 GDP-mannose 4,6-dehydratase [Nocardioides sp. B-3]